MFERKERRLRAPAQSTQTEAAASAQRKSQELSQQKGSSAQMAAQQPGRLHPGVPLEVPQEPAEAWQAGGGFTFGQASVASPTQMGSHAVSQQNSSMPHIATQQATSSQPGEPLAASQAPEPAPHTPPP